MATEQSRGAIRGRHDAGGEYRRPSAGMTPERWRQVSEVLDATLELPQAARRPYLRGTCAPDAELCQAAEDMLDACERGERDEAFLAEPAATVVAPIAAELDARVDAAEAALAAALADALRDRYTIERELARGGSAIIYLAQDHRNRRRVAIKALRPELTATLQAERFLGEIGITSRLVHPHILPLLESGRIGELLYYVTPYVEGESLRSRLAREHRLGVSDAVRIVREVATALDYAHRQGTVHRDVKPENILLADGQAMVADFGIARALTLATDERFTTPGAVPGTPLYMSPEHAADDTELDGRSDIYSLGCVLYELLAGESPFRAATAQGMFAQHVAAPVPDVRLVRPEVPWVVAAAVRRAMAKDPADRFPTASVFAEALEGRSAGWNVFERLRFARRHPVVTSVAGAALVGLAAWMLSPSARLDPSRYAVMPLGWQGGADSAPPDTRLLHEAFARWSGIDVVDGARVRRAALSWGDFGDWGGGARRIARSARAGLYVVAEMVPLGDSVRLHARLHDTRTDSVLAEVSTRAAAVRVSLEAAASWIAYRLLFGDDTVESLGTNSVPAHRAFLGAREQLHAWNLAAADSGFEDATRLDAGYAQAWLWLAQVRSWRGERPATWVFAAEQAGAGRSGLSRTDGSHADALLALAHGDVERACAQWARLAAADSGEFAPWYALGHCLRRDDMVVPDASSPSGWRFRSSYHTALSAYERAFRLQPSIHRSFRGGSFDDVRRLLMTDSDALRSGRSAPPDAKPFLAYPSWDADSLAFVPYPEDQFETDRSVMRTDASSVAIRRQRERLHQTALMWRAADPASADALEAVAVALDLLGNTSALDTLRAARALATEPDDRLRMASREIWMRVRLSTPRDLAGLRAARALGDSLLATHSPQDRAEARRLAALAALLGRGYDAARLTRQADARSASPSLAETGPALLAFAALGGPRDSLDQLEARVQAAIGALASSDRAAERAAWLTRPAFLALPEHRFASTAQAGAGSSGQARLLAAWRAGDLGEARRILAGLAAARHRAALRATERTADGFYPEAAILASLGDRRAALEWLEAPLDSLSMVEPDALADVARAGSLVRAMRLRAELSFALGDSASASTWAHAVLALWSHPDGFLQSTVQRMRALAR